MVDLYYYHQVCITDQQVKPFDNIVLHTNQIFITKIQSYEKFSVYFDESSEIFIIKIRFTIPENSNAVFYRSYSSLFLHFSIERHRLNKTPNPTHFHTLLYTATFNYSPPYPLQKSDSTCVSYILCSRNCTIIQRPTTVEDIYMLPPD